MTPNDLVARIRAGDVETAISEFLAAMPGLTLEALAVSAVSWKMSDISDVILRRLLDEEPDNLGAHLTLANSLFSQKRYAEALPHFRFTLRHKPEDPWYQSGVCWGYSHAQQPNELRRHLLNAKRAIPANRHISWQHARAIFMMPEDIIRALSEWIASLQQQRLAARRAEALDSSIATWFPRVHSNDPCAGITLLGRSTDIPYTQAYFIVDDTIKVPADGTLKGSAVLWTAAFTPTEGRVHCIQLCLDTAGGPKCGRIVEYTCRPAAFAVAETGPACELGVDGMTMSGSVAAAGEAAVFRFEYGTSPEQLDHETPWNPLPGNRNARQLISEEWTPQRRWYYSGEVSWAGQPSPQIRAHWPFGQDPNHISGIGFIELLFACWHNSVQFDGYQAVRKWECSDLRDADVHLAIQTHDLDTKDYLHCLGVGNVESYWMLTGQAIDLSDQAINGEPLTFRLSSDPSQWTFAGSNQEEQEDHARYRYGPLEDALARNIGNIVFTAPFGSPNNTTTGTISFGEVAISYRDNNVLHPDNCARLTEWPTHSHCDPAALTNGQYGAPEDGWYQLGPSETPPRFIWELPSPQSITTVIIHQDTVLPTIKCRLTLSDSSGAADSWELDLPVPEPPFKSPAHRTIQLEGSGTYSTVTLELLDGLSEDGMGIQAIEVFAKDFVPPPSTVPVVVSEDASGLEPGSTVYYRVVTKTEALTKTGNIMQLRVPDENSPPILHSIATYSTRPERTIIQVRANAMGRKADLHWRLDGNEWQKCPLGWENTPTHRYIVLDGITGGDHQVTVRFSSDAGESNETSYTFRTE